MIRSPSLLSPYVRALLEEERSIPAQPDLVRARAVARARAALAAGIVAPSDASRAARRPTWAAPVTFACLVSAATDLAAYEVHAHFARVGAAAAAAAAPAHPPSVAVPSTLGATATVAPLDEPPALSAVVPPPRRSLPAVIHADLLLLRQARAAVANRDCAAALSLIAEHARRFKEGGLTEEREALRVSALLGLGRNQEARHAAAEFRASFPHSVLLPAVDQRMVPVAERAQLVCRRAARRKR